MIAPLCATWDEIRHRLWSERCDRLGVNTAIETRHDRAAWNALCYCFFHARCAAHVVMRGPPEGDVIIWPFYNIHYRNIWPVLRDPQGGTDVVKYCRAVQLQLPSRDRVRIREDVGSWSNNGPLIDNWGGAREWGSDGMFVTWEQMLTACARRMDQRETCEFVLNRRDYPLLHAALLEPFDQPHGPNARAVGQWIRHAVMEPASGTKNQRTMHMCTIVSQYASECHADAHVPPLRAWAHDAPGATTHARRPPPWEHRSKRLTFRGSATGSRGGVPSQRARCVAAVRGRGDADVGIVKASARFRLGTDARVHMCTPAQLRAECGGAPLVPPRSLDEQMDAQWALYVEGNAGADRLAALLGRGFAVFVVRSEAPCVVWLRDGTLEPGRDFVDVASPEALPRVLEWASTHPAELRRIAEHGMEAWNRHMRRESIEDCVLRAVRCPGPPLLVTDRLYDFRRDSAKSGGGARKRKHKGHHGRSGRVGFGGRQRSPRQSRNRVHR